MLNAAMHDSNQEWVRVTFAGSPSGLTLTFYASRGLMTWVIAACLDSASINLSRLLLARPAECHCTAWHAAAWNL